MATAALLNGADQRGALMYRPVIPSRTRVESDDSVDTESPLDELVEPLLLLLVEYDLSDLKVPEDIEDFVDEPPRDPSSPSSS